MSGKVIQGTFLCGRPAIRTPAAPPPPPRQPGPPLAAHVAQPRSAHPQTPAGAMLRQPVPPAPAHVAQPQLVQRQPQPRVAAGAMPQRPGPPAPAFTPQARSAQLQPQAPGGAVAVDAALLRPTGRPGRPLPDALQRKMEQAFAADFSGVRVHEGPQAEQIGAIAFTVGNDIWFAPGRFQPHTAAGQQLLGHELAHVLQQRAGRVRNPLGAGLAVVQDRALEAEADRMGHRAAAQMMPAAGAVVGRGKGNGRKMLFTYSPDDPQRGRLLSARSSGLQLVSSPDVKEVYGDGILARVKILNNMYYGCTDDGECKRRNDLLNNWRSGDVLYGLTTVRGLYVSLIKHFFRPAQACYTADEVNSKLGIELEWPSLQQEKFQDENGKLDEVKYKKFSDRFGDYIEFIKSYRDTKYNPSNATAKRSKKFQNKLGNFREFDQNEVKLRRSCKALIAYLAQQHKMNRLHFILSYINAANSFTLSELFFIEKYRNYIDTTKILFYKDEGGESRDYSVMKQIGFDDAIRFADEKK